MSTPLVLTLFIVVTVAAIAMIMGAAVWTRSRSAREDAQPTVEATPEGHSLFHEEVEVR